MKGSTIWYLQRSSAIVNLIYIAYVFYFISSSDLTFEAWNNFFYSSIMIFLTLCFVASVIIHSFIGLWTVGTDYLTPRTLGFISSRLGGYANHFRLMYQLFFVTLSVTLILITLFLIWWS